MCHPDKVLEVVVSTTVPLGTSVINDAENGTRHMSEMEQQLWPAVAMGLFLISIIFAFALAIRIVRG